MNQSIQSEKSKAKISALSIAVLTATLGITPTYAADEENKADPEKLKGLEKIVVTTRKRTENLQQTPISITSFSADELESRQIDSSDQLTQITPNLSFSSNAPSSGNNASSQIFIRGIGQTEFLPTTDPGVGLYIDEVYMARSVGATLDFVDLQQIEILRGPQGTLFGRNTIGGAISLTTRRPRDEFEGYVDAKIGADNRQELKLSLDMPINDELLTSLSLGSRTRDGYVRRLLDGTKLGDDNSQGGRFAVNWLPSDNLNVYWTIDYIDENETGSPIAFNGLGEGLFTRLAKANPDTGCASATFDEGDLRTRCENSDWNAGPYANYGTGEVESTFESWGTSLIVAVDFTNFSLKSITSYREMEWSSARDADNTPLVILHTRNDDTQNQFSQEIQLTGDAYDGALNWLTGIYYFNEEATDDYYVPTAVGIFNTGGLVENDSIAAFGQLTYDFTKQLSLTVGVRWTEENKGFFPIQFTESTYLFPIAGEEQDGEGGYIHPFDGNIYPTVGGGNVAVVPEGTLFFPLNMNEEQYSDTTPMFNLSYQINDKTMVYFGYSEGFKSGGYNARNIKPGPVVRTFEPEKAATFEFGFKADLLENRLRLNGAIFSTAYTELQFVIREDFAPIVFNAGEAEIRGFELELTWLASENLEVVSSLGYVDAEYTDLSQEIQDSGVTLSNSLPHVPELNSSLGLVYTYEIPGGGIITPRVDWAYRDDVFFDSLNSPEISQDGYNLINASVNWVSSEYTYSATFGVTNLSDELFKVAGNTALNESSSYSEVVYARGREWSLSAKYRF
jgi:iron complex outermembrane receptor protein